VAAHPDAASPTAWVPSLGCRVAALLEDATPTTREHLAGQHVAARFDDDSPSGSMGARETTMGQHVAPSDALGLMSGSFAIEYDMLPSSSLNSA
jgi:hypothetical protein